jgi:hypothetical protein
MWENLSGLLCQLVLGVIIVLIALYLWTEHVQPMIKKSGFQGPTILGHVSGRSDCLIGNEKNPWNTCNMS